MPVNPNAFAETPPARSSPCIPVRIALGGGEDGLDPPGVADCISIFCSKSKTSSAASSGRFPYPTDVTVPPPIFSSDSVLAGEGVSGGNGDSSRSILSGSSSPSSRILTFFFSIGGDGVGAASCSAACTGVSFSSFSLSFCSFSFLVGVSKV